MKHRALRLTSGHLPLPLCLTRPSASRASLATNCFHTDAAPPTICSKKCFHESLNIRGCWRNFKRRRGVSPSIHYGPAICICIAAAQPKASTSQHPNHIPTQALRLKSQTTVFGLLTHGFPGRSRPKKLSALRAAQHPGLSIDPRFSWSFTTQKALRSPSRRTSRSLDRPTVFPVVFDPKSSLLFEHRFPHAPRAIQG